MPQGIRAAQAAQVARLLELLAAENGRHGCVAKIAEAMGLPISTVRSRIERMGGLAAATERAKRGQAVRRVCPCGQKVHNDEATDYRRCERCRGTPGVRPLGAMAMGGRWG